LQNNNKSFSNDVSTKTSCPNNKTIKAKFITENNFYESTYLYENKMFTNKVNQDIVWGGRGKDRGVSYIKFLINARV